MGTNVFYGGNHLVYAKIGNGVTSIGMESFYGCGLTGISIGTNVSNIGDNSILHLL